MAVRTPGRRARTAAALCAATALMGLTGCIPDGKFTTDERNGTGAGTGAGQDAGQDDDPGAGGDLTRIILVTELETDDSRTDGDPIIEKADLATLLTDRFGGSAECHESLVLGPDYSSTRCVGPSVGEGVDSAQDWTAHAVWVRPETGFGTGSSAAVLFQTGTELPEGATDLLEDDVILTGVGIGSMFGAEPLSAEEVAESTLTTLTSENALASVAADAEWTEVTCEEGLDFADFGTAPCTATTGEGDSFDLVVAPGTYADGDQGLLVGIRTGVSR